MIFKSAEEARAHVQATKVTSDQFELAISNDFTFAGRPDATGAGMVIVIDAILAQDFGPDGFEQRVGYRLYRYKPLNPGDKYPKRAGATLAGVTFFWPVLVLLGVFGIDAFCVYGSNIVAATQWFAPSPWWGLAPLGLATFFGIVPWLRRRGRARLVIAVILCLMGLFDLVDIFLKIPLIPSIYIGGNFVGILSACFVYGIEWIYAKPA